MDESASDPVSIGSPEGLSPVATPAGEARPRLLRDRLLIALLLCLGISEPIAYLADWPSIRAVARISSASNCPLVFNQVGGIEFWASSFEFQFVGRDGVVSTVPVTREVLSGVRGPHTRTAAYVVPIGLGPVIGPAFYQAPLLFGLCDHGQLARDLGYEGDLEAAKIRIRSGSPNDNREWVLELRCGS